VFNLGVPGWQTQGVGSDFQLTLEVVAVAGLQDGFELGLLGGQLVEVSIWLGVRGVNLIRRAWASLIWLTASSTTSRTVLLGSSCGSCGR
jgi:hypothetical protein